MPGGRVPSIPRRSPDSTCRYISRAGNGDDASVTYCPSCGAEYRAGFSRCPDCDVELQSKPPTERALAARQAEVVLDERVEVFITGRRIDAELVRGMLEANGLDARIWSGGMGVYRLESGLTELTGVPNAFNSYRVVVRVDEETTARELLRDASLASDEPEPTDHKGDPSFGFLDLIRGRWILVAFAIFFVIMILRNGPPG
ncbi:MAG: putative prokaryotic signal transducing protein [Actinomycetota bacterium]|jgi:hypothetical protein|nr:putative prokaryotic signal transducing protein [Actinomycetota bacterium]